MSSTGLKTLSSICVLSFLTTPLFAQAKVSGDFDNDGFDDLAIGVPYEDNGAISNCGAVHVLYGETPSITTAGTDLFFQSSVGLSDEAGDLWGLSLAAGDFDADGFDDLAIGAPYEDVSVSDQGGVTVLYGSATGLVTAGMQFLTYGGAAAAAGDRYGYALTAANLIGASAFEELAIGIPYRNAGGDSDAGEVEVRRGSATGLTTATLLNQDTAGVGSSTESGDRFGYSLTAGDFDNDGDQDLVVGVPYENSGAIADAGYVNVFNGGAGSITASVSFVDVAAATGGDEASDLFGFSLAAGDFGGDGDDDLAVGKPYEDIGADANAGEINVHYGSPSGLITTLGNAWNQDTASVPGATEPSDLTGYALTSDNFNGDAYQDLAIGCPTEDIGAGSNQGYVIVLYGASGSLSATGSTSLTGTTCAGGVEDGDEFGYDLAAGDVNNSGSADLFIGTPFEDVGAVSNAGGVNVRYAVTGTNQCWSQNTAGVPNSSEANDYFGIALAH